MSTWYYTKRLMVELQLFKKFLIVTKINNKGEINSKCMPGMEGILFK